MAAAEQPKIFKRVEVIEGGGHHGGGWKVAYADFMTAMMAFFLLMWILASSDEQALKGIAQYFTDATLPGGSGVLDGATIGPPGTLSASNGSIVARGSELGAIDDPTPATWEIRDVTPNDEPNEAAATSHDGVKQAPSAGNTQETDKKMEDAIEGMSGAAAGQSENSIDGAESLHAADDAKFEELQNEVLQAIQASPELDKLQQSVIFEKTPEGLHIQIIDQEGQPMFQSGRAEMVSSTEELMTNLGESLADLPNKIVISGHTDAVPFADSNAYDNWDLSSDRANVTRRVFLGTGVTQDRIVRVSGLADTDLLVPEDPKDPSNRRISIMVQYNTPEDTDTVAEDPAMATGEPTLLDEAQAVDTKSEKTILAAPEVKIETSPVVVPAADKEVFNNLRNALR
jgi:chemotaxis protein MotB